MPSPRVSSPYPRLATIVFSGAHKPDNIEALRRREVEAAMLSFDFFKTPKRWEMFHRKVMPCFDWPVRRYLDSGVYSLMRRAGVARAKYHLDANRDKDPKRFFSSTEEAYAAFETMAAAYLEYLAEYHHEWDHIVELDVDQLFGSEVTVQWRTKLKGIVGDKLLPVWHQSGGWDSWTALVDEFSYVGIGGDAGTGVSGLRTEVHLAEYRAMVNYAHDHGVAVQGFGDTRLRTFLATHWDTSDSTTWLTGAKWGQVGHLKASVRPSRAQSPQGSSKVRAWSDWLAKYEIDPARALQAETSIEKLLCWVILLQERQAEIRRTFQEWGVEVTSVKEHSWLPANP